MSATLLNRDDGLASAARLSRKESMNIVCEMFAGEFGWELFVWQGYLRFLAQQGHQLFIACEQGRELLYLDFATEMQTCKRLGSIRDMWGNKNWESYHPERPSGNCLFLQKAFDGDNVETFTLLRNNTYQTRNWSVVGSTFFKKQKLIPFVDDSPPDEYLFDILIHARNLYKYNTQYRNWKLVDLENFVNEVTKLGYKIAFVGLKSESISIAGIPNYQDIPLSRLAQIMKRSRMIVGPLSGIMHFATLCKLPQVSWVTKAEHKQRLEQTWNPFSTSVDVLYSGTDTHWQKKTYWIPAVSQLVEAVQRMENRLI